jgi:hypothetical protein
MVIAKTPSLNAINRMVSRDTKGWSAPTSPPGARAIASDFLQRLSERSQIEDDVAARL